MEKEIIPVKKANQNTKIPIFVLVVSIISSSVIFDPKVRDFFVFVNDFFL